MCLLSCLTMYPPHNISQKNTLEKDGRSGPYCPYRVFHIAPYAGQNGFFKKKKNQFFYKISNCNYISFGPRTIDVVRVITYIV